MNLISRRDLIRGALAVRVAGLAGKGFGISSKPAKSLRLKDFGWTWEGQGMTGGAGVSIYGLGEGAEYFGLRKVFALYGPNDEPAMEKLRSFDEVVCEISANRPIHCGERCVESWYDSTHPRFLAEARTVANLSLKYPNLRGAYIDDTLGSGKPNGITGKLYASIYDTLKSANPNVKLWALVFSEQLYNQDWSDFKPKMEVINLWIFNEKGLRDLDRHVDSCRKLFSDRPLILGCFLWDYPSMKYDKGEFEKGHAISMDLLKFQWERVLMYLETGKIDGYTILGAYQIDGAPEQARWIKDFIATNS